MLYKDLGLFFNCGIIFIGDDMKKPLIGIVGRPMLNDENTTLIGVLESYRKAIIKSGGIPFLILILFIKKQFLKIL